MIPFVFEQLCGETVVIWGFDKQEAAGFTKRKHLFNGPCRVIHMFDARPGGNQVKGFFFKRSRRNFPLEHIKAIPFFCTEDGISRGIDPIDRQWQN